MDGVDDLTPVAQDYLKVIWSAVEWGEPPITTKGLAARFATTQANVSDTMHRLQARGLVNYQPYKPVTLTALGERLALQMVRRHRLIETFLAEALGYAWDEVHDEAERLEHAVSDELLSRIDNRLGHPSADPHGDPIPSAAGDWTPPTAVRIAEVPPGRYRVVRVSDSDPDRLVRLRTLGIVPGALVQVHASEPLSVSVDLRPAVPAPAELEPDDLAAVRVRPV